jgi:hypothetical protein
LVKLAPFDADEQRDMTLQHIQVGFTEQHPLLIAETPSVDDGPGSLDGRA